MSELTNGEQDASPQPSELGKSIARYEHGPTHELGYLHETDLRIISSKAYAADETDRAVARPFFKKIIVSAPSWYRAASFARSVPDLAYSPEERKIMEDEGLKAEERRNLVEREIDSGISPWLAHVHHNEQGMRNPYVVGFYQDNEGKMRPVYGERYFRSQRQIENTFFGGRTETKEVNLLSTQFQRAEGASIQKSEYWNLLPEDLRSKFEGGEILVTGGNDLYDLSEAQIEQLARSSNPRAVTEHVQQAVRSAPDGYRLLYYSDHRSNDTGRTGVLMTLSAGEAKPVTVDINGKEYVIELKGCGTKAGGFAAMHHRTGRDIVTGSAEKEQAVNEFDRLSENIGTDKPKPIGSIVFDANGYEQGYIIRLTPSTVRASYSGNEVYPEIDRQENVERVLKMYAGELADQIFAPNPKILDRSSHTENLLVWGNGRFTFTDFSGHVAFNDRSFPHNENQGGYMTPKQMLEYYIKMVKEIPGYAASRDQQSFYRALSGAFFNKGKDLWLERGDTPEIATQKVWEQGGMAYQVFKARKEGKYVAEGALHKFDEKINGQSASSRRELGLDSEAAFTQRLQAGLTGMKQALAALRTRMTTSEDREVMDKGLALVEQGDLVTDDEVMNGVYQRMTKVINYEDPEDKKIREAFSYVGSLSYTLSPIRDYLEHEADVINAAKVGAPPHERDDVQAAGQELQERMDQFVTTVRTPHALFQLLTDQEQARRMIEFSYYTA